MIDVLQSIAAFIVALGLLITFHEFGHYWVARRCDVKILRFSIGFGRPIWKRTRGEDATEFVIAALPLGGYVKMLDEREGKVNDREKNRAFNNKSLLQRIAIVVAGPAFNFIFAILAYWIIFMIGFVDLKPVIGEVKIESIAMEAGFRKDQEITMIDGRDIQTWSAVIDSIVAKVVKGNHAIFTVVGTGGRKQEIDLDMSLISIDDMASGQLLTQLGLTPKIPKYPAVIGAISPGGAAERAGMQPGDYVIIANGTTIDGWIDWVEFVQSHPQQTLDIEVMRNNQVVSLVVTPDPIEGDDGKIIGRIGAGVDQSFNTDSTLFNQESYGPIPALIKSIDKTVEMSVMTLRILSKMIVGEASVKNLSGPITIAKFAGDTANMGIVSFLGFLAIVSVSLGVLNLLPVPILDGGHLLYYLIEAIKGSPVSESMLAIGQQLGLVLLLGLMSIALYNDILRLIS